MTVFSVTAGPYGVLIGIYSTRELADQAAEGREAVVTEWIVDVTAV